MTLVSRFPAEVCERMKRDGGRVFPAATNSGDPTVMAVKGLSGNEAQGQSSKIRRRIL
jgi:hypothetical protein